MTEVQAEQVCLEYHGKVSAYVGSRISDPHTAEDLVSSVFLKVCQGLDRFDADRASLSTWIYTLTRNTVIDHFRRHKVHCALDEMLEDPRTGVEEQVLSEELLEQLASALEALEERERDLINLHYFEQRSLKDIAAAMQISYSGAKLIHTRALGQLRKLLS